MSKRIPCLGSNPPRNTPNNRPHKGAKPKGCWLKDGQCIAANASTEVFEVLGRKRKLEGGVNESLACKGKGKRTNTGPRC